jgi:hypothetical protein
MAFLLLAAGALLSVAAQQVYDRLKALSSARHVKIAQQNRTLPVQKESRTKTIAYYTSRQWTDALYQTTDIVPGTTLPLLSSGFRLRGRIDPYTESVMTLDNVHDELPVNQEHIKALKRAGAVVFDGEALYAKRIMTSGSSVDSITLRRCNYFSYASLSTELQNSLQNPSRRNQRIIAEHLRNFETAITNPVQPQVLGHPCVTLFTGSGGVAHVAMALRSPEVLTASGMKSVLPNFGVEANILGQSRSKFSISYYNYLREFAEEFFDYEELIDIKKAQRIHPDWILSLPEVARVVAEIDAGRFRLEHLGIGLNPADNSLLTPLLARFESTQYMDTLITELRANWESSSDMNGSTPIQFLPLFSATIDEWARRGELDPVSAHALDLARSRIREEQMASTGSTA